MKRLTSIIYSLLLMAGWCFPISASTRQLQGRVVAYDPAYHSFKHPSFVKNLEVVVLRVDMKQHFLKVIVEGFGSTQIPDEILQGKVPFSARGIRDKSCDETHPQFSDRVDITKGSGVFFFNSGMSRIDLKIGYLRCYRVVEK